MFVTLLTALALASAVLTILATYQGRRLTLYLFKPLTMLFIITAAMQEKHQTTSFYRYAVILGLLFSLAGDVFLMLPRDCFILGLISFLIAHLFYLAAFAYEADYAYSLWALAPLMIYGLLMLRGLWPHLGKMRLPVCIYTLAILAMGWAAASRWALTNQEGSLLALLGAALFITSDSALAVDRFRGHFRSAQLLILGTYFPAQCLIALST